MEHPFHHSNSNKDSPSSNQDDRESSPTSALEMLLRVQAKEESWIPLRQALGGSWKSFQRMLDDRVMKAIAWLNSLDGPDFTTLFVTEHQSDAAVLKDFKYDDVYNEVNRAIIESQIKFCKNPDTFRSLKFNPNDGDDPMNPGPTDCTVLYSGNINIYIYIHL